MSVQTLWRRHVFLTALSQKTMVTAIFTLRAGGITLRGEFGVALVVQRQLSHVWFKT